MNQELETRQVLIVENKLTAGSDVMRKAIERLECELADKNIESIRAESYPEAFPIVETSMDVDCFLIASGMNLDKSGEAETFRLLKQIRERQACVPVFLLADRAEVSEHLSGDMMSMVTEFVWIFEDSPRFIAGRVEDAVERFRDGLLPPLMKAIWEYNENNHEYSWAAPGHQGGIGFTKGPAGKKFFDFYGENLFRTDTGIERSSIGSLLDHEGAFAKSEAFAAKVFGADHSYSVVVGTSGSNRTVMQACISSGDLVFCDRNCHKSIEQGLILTGGIPVYMTPTRNRYGIIGPVPRSEMCNENLMKKTQSSALVDRIKSKKAVYSVLTNCTYDGICYNAERVEAELEKSCDRIHFDEAWYAYARFNPMYQSHFAMRGDPAKHEGATIFATHSTHKLLNALSQASYIHVRDGRNAIDFDRFNQAYMMHATTSPLYAICASNDISTAMMHNSGESLIREVIAEAVDFRQATARLCKEYTAKGSWFFQPWNAEELTDPETKKKCCFATAPRDVLIRNQCCWKLRPGDAWHGFDNLDDDWVMLDPIKVSILTPGMGTDGNLLENGVPAALVSYYLYQRGIIPTRTTDFQVMFLFSMGVTKGKWGTLLNTLLNFKRAYDKNMPLSDLFPCLVKKYGIYAKEGLHDLGDRMFDYLRREKPGEQLNKAFETLPAQVLTPAEAYDHIVRGCVEFVAADHLSGRVAANSVIPYPPGIPMLMSGENFGGKDSPQIRYLKGLEAWDKEFPGFEHETEGAKVIDGVYHVMCVKQ